MARIKGLFVSGLIVAVAVMTVTAQEAPPEEYVEAMQTIRGAMQAANAEGDPDFAAISEAATEARDAFLYVQTFWQERDNEEMAALAGDASRAAASMAVSANLMSADGAHTHTHVA